MELLNLQGSWCVRIDIQSIVVEVPLTWHRVGEILLWMLWDLLWVDTRLSGHDLLLVVIWVDWCLECEHSTLEIDVS